MKNQLNPLAAALTCGFVWALALFIWTLAANGMGVGSKMLDLFTDIYPWYQVTVAGAFWGLLWGFIDGFIGAYIFVTVYNFFVKKLGK